MKLSRERIAFLIVALVLSAGLVSVLHNERAQAQTGDDDLPGVVVYASDREGNYEIYTLDPQTGVQEQLTEDPGNDIEPVWSPDGTKIAFVSDRDGDYELYVMDADGANVEQLTLNDVEDRQPRWQPNSTHIVYSSNVNDQPDLYVISINTMTVRQITNDEFSEIGPNDAPPAVTPGAVTTPVAVVTATPSAPDAVVNAPSLNIRANPGQGASVLATIPNTTPLTVLGRISDSSWLQVRTADNITGWVAAPFVTLNIPLANVPFVTATFIAPPTAAPTAVPATAAPVATTAPTNNANVNLVAGTVVLDPAQPSCGQTFTVGFDVANLGSQASSVSSTVSLVDKRTADGTQQATTIGGFPVLQPNQTFRVSMPLTVSTWYSESHTLTLVIDPNNQVPEAGKTDNTGTLNYTLQKGTCP